LAGVKLKIIRDDEEIMHTQITTIFTIILVACNTHLVLGAPPANLIFLQSAVHSNEWWRILTHPFVHVTWYHLLLDVSVFMLLWSELKKFGLFWKLIFLLSCATGSLVLSVLFSPIIENAGLCGLSGVTHGLTAILGLNFIKQACRKQHSKPTRKKMLMLGSFILFAIIIKSLYEVTVGVVFFENMHWGQIGTPVVHAHLGGTMGGIVSFCIYTFFSSSKFIYLSPNIYKQTNNEVKEMRLVTFIVLVSVLATLFFTLLTSNSHSSLIKPHDNGGDTVILMHGLGRTKSSMNKIQKSLKAIRFNVINIQYPSTCKTVQEISEQHLKPAVEKAQKHNRTIHFVTHSMGGIIVRQFLNNNDISLLGRVVMLAPPNQGSEVADFLKNNPIYNLAMGPAGQQLGTSEKSLPHKLGPVNFELGVIAGNKSLNPVFSMLLDGPNDGTVSVKNTTIEGMKDFLVMPYTHTFMMKRAKVIEQVINFLCTGSFTRP